MSSKFFDRDIFEAKFQDCKTMGDVKNVSNEIIKAIKAGEASEKDLSL